jgi:hypothetical protein
METDMPIMASATNPFGRFRNGAVASADGREWPIPLAATRIDVTIRGGLAIVATERLFRNSEPRAIEATMTFPVPVDATFCALSARIDGRTLQALAQPRSGARKAYEDAIDQGCAAVLHEELIKGVHMLSVGQIGPGAEIAVSATWTAPLSFIGDSPRLRIPTTVGEIYGRSPLVPADDLTVGGTVHEATVSITCEDGIATLIGAGPLTGGRHTVALDHPIDLVITGFVPRLLAGVAADGRKVELSIAPIAKAGEALAVDVLFDRSGSMMERAIGEREAVATKFEAAKAGLLAVARNRLKSGDRLQLWQFNDTVGCLGEAAGAAVAKLVGKLDEPTGGTEIARAFDAVAAKSKCRNVVIVTDGKSWSFDPQAVARRGLRVTAVLIGEDALEGGVGDLAGISGGQVFAATGSDVAAAIEAAFDAARTPHRAAEPIEGPLTRIEAFRRGARLVASWGAQAKGPSPADARPIGATAAMLAIPLMEKAAAAALAAREGIVCHLTSLVLVDDAGTRHEGIPATRKVAASAPRTMFHIGGVAPAAAARAMAACTEAAGCAAEQARVRPRPMADSLPAPASGRPHVNLTVVLQRMDWDADPDALRRGDLYPLAPAVAALIREAAKLPEVGALAQAAGLDPVAAVIALLAKAAGKSSRSAGRLARNLLGHADAAVVERALDALGLRSLSPIS